ncbi:MAG: fibrobacter succinogenes major paralogous domain-containing protein [Fibrobacter sp.]|nr:fibrobacter succinogenes major paralogous domain-containing protein [Fibrobacter sp.]
MLKAGVAISGAALLFACGDDSSSGAEGSQTATGVDSTVESIDDLLNCTSKHEGETAYIKEEKATYVCVDGDWITGSISESVDDLINCTSKHEGETVFVKEDKEIYVCTDGDWVVAGETLDEGDDDGDDADKKSSSSKAKSADSKGKSSSSDGNDDGKSSSSSKAKSSSSVESSSSVIPGSDPESSSSDGNDDGKSSSSSTAKSSSSEGGGGASSSSVIASSSSEELVSSSSFNKSSSSSRGLFEMSKDEFLNPKISYGEMTDERDYKKYKTVEICNKDKSECQIWMAENLNYADSTKTPSLKGKSWCYDNKAKNCDVTGRLYTWAAAIDSVALANDADNPQTCGYGKTCTLPTVVQGVCPEGWHLPSYDEWETLFTAVGGSSKAGTALKSQTGWYSQTGDAADRDAYGFSALPAGYRYSDGNFIYAGNYASFWSASEYSSGSAYRMDLYCNYENAFMDDINKLSGFSVRCLQN